MSRKFCKPFIILVFDESSQFFSHEKTFVWGVTTFEHSKNFEKHYMFYVLFEPKKIHQALLGHTLLYCNYVGVYVSMSLFVLLSWSFRWVMEIFLMSTSISRHDDNSSRCNSFLRNGTIFFGSLEKSTKGYHHRRLLRTPPYFYDDTVEHDRKSPTAQNVVMVQRSNVHCHICDANTVTVHLMLSKWAPE